MQQVLDLGVLLVRGHAGSKSTSTSSGTRSPSRRASSPDDHLGDQRLAPLGRAGELDHVGAQVVGLDDPGHRAARPQRVQIAQSLHLVSFSTPASLTVPSMVWLACSRAQ